MWQHLKALMTAIKENVGLFIATVATLGALGITVSTPWPTRAEMLKVEQDLKEVRKFAEDRHKEVAQQISQMLNDQREIGMTTLKIQKIFLKRDLEDARKELEQMPNSRAARLRVEELAETIEALTIKIETGAHP